MNNIYKVRVKGHSSMMGSMLDSAKGGILKYIVLFFIVLATGGLVLTDVGGFFTGGVTSTSIAKVAGKEISIQQFDRDVRNMTYSQGVSPQDAYRTGLIQQYLQTLIGRALLKQAASDNGLRLGAKELVGDVRQYVEPYINDETTASDAFKNMLRSQNMSEKEFTEVLEQDAVNQLMKSVLTGTVTIPGAMAIDFAKGLEHTRKISALVLDINAMPVSAQPTDGELAEFYESVKDNYRTEETRDFDVLMLKIDDIAAKIVMTDEQLQSYYEDNIDVFTKPEKRSIEQSLVKTEADALKIYQLADEGKTLEQATEAVTGNTKAYRKADSFEQAGLLKPLVDAAFAADKGALVEPVETPLGWHVARTVSITAAEKKSFASVKKDVEKELRAELLEDQFYELSLDVEETLDSGVSVAEVAEEYGLTIKKLSKVSRYDTSKELDFIEDKARFLDLAFGLEEMDSSQLMGNGNDYLAFTVQHIVPSDYKGFEAVKASVKAEYLNEQKRIAAQQLIANTETALKDNTSDMIKLAATSPALSYKLVSKLARYGEPPAYLTGAQIPLIFQAKAGDVQLFNSKSYYVLARVESIDLPDDAQMDERDVLTQAQTLSAIMENAFVESYLAAIENRYGSKVNAAALDQLYGQSSEEQ
jgi:peptidyl-prolyl cis-trans isomerase D